MIPIALKLERKAERQTKDLKCFVERKRRKKKVILHIIVTKKFSSLAQEEACEPVKEILRGRDKILLDLSPCINMYQQEKNQGEDYRESGV